MRRILVFLLVLVFGLAGVWAKEVEVKGYKRKDGTVVQPHRRTAPNNTKNDNWSTRGNVNPYTGKQGTKPRGDEVAKHKPAKSPVYLQPHSPQVKETRQQLESEIRQCERIIDRYVKQSSFSTLAHLRVSTEEYQPACAVPRAPELQSGRTVAAILLSARILQVALRGGTRRTSQLELYLSRYEFMNPKQGAAHTTRCAKYLHLRASADFNTESPFCSCAALSTGSDPD